MDPLLISVSIVVLIILSPVASGKRKDQMKKYCGIYYHRGCYDNLSIAENSIAAFKKCTELHCGIELDVQLTKDKRLIVFHDDDLLRMCGVDMAVKDSAYDDIKSLSLLNTDAQIPLLAEVLKSIGGRVPVYVELKCHDQRYKDLTDQAIALIKEYPGNYLLCSFNPLILRYLKKQYPEYLRGIIASGSDRKNILTVFLGYMFLNWLACPDFISYDFQKETWPLKWNRLLGRILAGWTIADIKQYQKIKDHYQLYVIEHFDPREGCHEQG